MSGFCPGHILRRSVFKYLYKIKKINVLVKSASSLTKNLPLLRSLCVLWTTLKRNDRKKNTRADRYVLSASLCKQYIYSIHTYAHIYTYTPTHTHTHTHTHSRTHTYINIQSKTYQWSLNYLLTHHNTLHILLKTTPPLPHTHTYFKLITL